MTGDASLEDRAAVAGAPSLQQGASPQLLAPLRGELRRLPPRATLRVIQALTLFTLIRSTARAIARYTLDYRHKFVLHLRGSTLVVERERVLLGRVVRRSRTVLPLLQLEEITLERAGEPAAFTAGLAALAGGTFFGTRFISEGVLAPGLAPWLLGGGSLLILSGLLLDFFVGSGRAPAHLSGGPEISLRTSTGRGWVLARMGGAEAEELLGILGQTLTTLGQLPDGSEPQELPAQG